MFLSVVVCVSLLIACLAGCGNDAGSGGNGSGSVARLLKGPVQNSVRIVLEAEAALAVEPDMAVEDFPPCTHLVAGVQSASGGRCVTVPKDANKNRKEDPRGKLALRFSVPKEGVYYIHPRAWWKDGCSNSFGMAVDGAKPLLVTDATYEVWHWIKLLPDDPKSGQNTRGFKLSAGEHILVFTNREDNVKLDQVY